MSTTGTTAVVTINAAFLQEIKEVNAELWQVLHELKLVCETNSWVDEKCQRIVSQFTQLRDQLALHFALEEAYGYFDDPVVVAPRLSASAERLRSEHRTLYEKANELTEYVEDLHANGRLMPLAHDIAERFQNFHNALMVHEECENELIQQAYNDDLGTGD